VKREHFSNNNNSNNNKEDYFLDLLSTIAKSLQAILSDFYSRWSRKPFYNPKLLWIIPETESRVFKNQLSEASWGDSTGEGMAPGVGSGNFAKSVLRALPWSIPFNERLSYFRSELDRERLSIQGSNDNNLYSMLGLTNAGYRSKGTIITIHRERLLHDSMNSLLRLSSSQWKDRLVIRYIDSFGNEEKGIDIGGLFKDFVTDLSSTVFNASYGLFIQSNDHLLFPNPFASFLYSNNGNGSGSGSGKSSSSSSASNHELEETYRFLGRVLGKAIYENITISPQFAYFFLSFMNGKYNFMNLLSDLRTLDPELYKNLMFLKSYEVSTDYSFVVFVHFHTTFFYCFLCVVFRFFFSHSLFCVSDSPSFCVSHLSSIITFF
jgi:hypothetical protein